MAKTFYYDSIGLIESTLQDGTMSGTTFSASSSITNEERVIDQSISTAVTAIEEDDAMRFTLSGNKAVDFIAAHFNASEADSLLLAYDNNDSGAYEATPSTMNGFTANIWQVDEFSSQSKQYWIIHASTGGGLVGLTEVILGAKLAFDMNPDIGIGEQEIYGTDIQRSIGGVEYGTKSHDPISTISMNFSSIPSSFKTSLQSMESDVQDFKKFVYSEDGTTGPFHYVRLDGPISYSEVAYQRYSASFTLREQLS